MNFPDFDYNFIINQELLDELNKAIDEKILEVKKPLQEINEEQLDNLVAALNDKESHDFYHNLRREKYAFADKMLDILTFGATSKENCSGVPVRLILK